MSHAHTMCVVCTYVCRVPMCRVQLEWNNEIVCLYASVKLHYDLFLKKGILFFLT